MRWHGESTNININHGYYKTTTINPKHALISWLLGNLIKLQQTGDFRALIMRLLLITAVCQPCNGMFGGWLIFVFGEGREKKARVSEWKTRQVTINANEMLANCWRTPLSHSITTLYSLSTHQIKSLPNISTKNDI